MNRRSFFVRTVGALVAAVVGPKIAPRYYRVRYVDMVATTPDSGVCGGINRATFSFWRNRQFDGAPGDLYAAMAKMHEQTKKSCILGDYMKGH